MSALLEIEPSVEPTDVVDSEQHLSIAANWERYEGILKALGANCRGLRLTYDRGRLEFMSISSTHDRHKYILGRIIDTVTEELGILLVGQGETTIRRQDLDRGFEPDAWYYIQNAARMHHVQRELNFESDPAPDLAIKIEISRSLIDRIGLYAAIGVREIWRYDGTTVQILVLQGDGEYVESPTSSAIPSLTAIDVNRFVLEAGQQNPTIYFRGLRNWIRDNLPPITGTN